MEIDETPRLIARVTAATAAIFMLGCLLAAQSPSSGASAPPPAASRPGQTTAPTTGNAPDTTANASIRGRVTAADNGAPIRGAQLTMTAMTSGGGAPRQGRTTVADEQGAYEFTGLTAGRYRIRAAKTGFVTMEYGQKPPYRTPGEPVIELAAGQALDRADFILPRGGVAVVTVTDPGGEPLAGVQVDLLQWRFTNGRRTLTPTGSQQVETDDRGQARSFGLMPGDYYVSVRSGFGSGNTMYAPTYYPGTVTAQEAQRIPIASARETQVTVPVVAIKPGRISGVARMSDGTPIRQSIEVAPNPSGPPTYNVGLRQNTPGGGFSSTTISMKPDGSFDVRNVIPGDYSIDVRPTLGATANPQQEYAFVPITVTSDGISGLVITTSRGATIHGQLSFDTGRPPDNLTADRLRISVLSTSADPNGLSGGQAPTMHDDFSFDITGVTGPGLLGLSSTSGWFTKSVVIEGKEVTQTPFIFELGHDYKGVEVVLTQKRATATGQVTDGQGRPVQDYAVVLFPEERTLWYPRNRVVFAGRPAAGGTFRIDQIPEGNYLAVAVDRLDPGEEQDAELLAALAQRATRVVLRDGETKLLSLRQEIRQEAR